jgi:F-type H+-transporting ATPase subunit delta
MPLIESQPDAVATTYAHVLFHLAMDTGGQNAVEACSSELDGVLELARADKQFGEFLSSRIIPADQRSVSLEKILSGKVSNTTLRFLQVLNEKGRIAHLPAVVEAYDAHVQQAFGRVEVDVWTAAPLDDGEKANLQNALTGKLGRQVVMHCYTDATMIGGVRIQVGDQLLDASVSTQLNKLREQLSTRGAPAVRAAADRIFSAGVSNNGH